MKVKVGDKIHNCTEEPVMVILSIHDKRNIFQMSCHADRYASYPDEMSSQDANEWMDIPDDERPKLKLDKTNYPALGDFVIVHDSEGKEHTALVNCIHGENQGDGTAPLINAVCLADEATEDHEDSFGRKVNLDFTSMHHVSQAQGTHGYYWRYPYEQANEGTSRQA